jgi:hypothetical protein
VNTKPTIAETILKSDFLPLKVIKSPNKMKIAPKKGAILSRAYLIGSSVPQALLSV